MAEHQLPKLNTRVRFPSSAPSKKLTNSAVRKFLLYAEQFFGNDGLGIGCWRYVTLGAYNVRTSRRFSGFLLKQKSIQGLSLKELC